MAYIQSLLAEYGLWLVLIGTFLEGETIVIVAGFASHQGLFDPVHVAALAALGSFCCDQMWFFIARKFGHRPVIQRMKHRPAFERALHFLERHPTAFIFSFRFVYGIRNVSPAVIGLSEIDAHKFFVLNALAAMLWATAFTFTTLVTRVCTRRWFRKSTVTFAWVRCAATDLSPGMLRAKVGR